MAGNSQKSPISSLANDIKFVQEVRDRPCLYDTTTKIYGMLHARKKAWKEIAEIMQMPVSACTAKWKTIRDRYVRVYRRSGSEAADGIEDPSWILSTYLSFLTPSIKPKRRSRNYPEFPSQTEMESQASLEITQNEPSNTMEKADEPSNTMEKADEPSNTMEKVLQALQAPVVIHPQEPASQAPREESRALLEESATYLFLTSLQEDMDSASPRALRNMKIRILQVIQEELEQDSRQNAQFY